MRIEEFFKDLLRVATGNRICIHRPLSTDEWETVYLICELHNVLGVAFSGILKLPEEQMPPSELFAKWQEDVLKEKERREKVAEICRKACETHEKNGFSSCVLMPRPPKSPCVGGEVRDGRLEVSVQSGEVRRPPESPCVGGEVSDERFEFRGGDYRDIDILCWSKEKKDGKRTIVEYVNFQYVASTHHIKPKVVRHHANIESGNIPLEVHFKSDYLNNPWYNARFETWVRDMVDRARPPESPCVGGLDEVRGEGVERPSKSPCIGRLAELPDEFFVVYQLLHLYRKLFCEGIRLGHLVEYYYTLREFSDERLEGRDKRLEIIERLGMKKFAGAVMYVLQTVFAMPDDYLICKPDAKHGSFVQNMIMMAGEYTRYIERTRTLRHLGRIGHHLYWIKRNRPFITQYPAEMFFELYKRIKG